MIRIVTAVIFGALAVATAGAQQRVYRWVDAQGVVHYSQTEPDNAEAQARDLKVPRTAATAAPAAESPEQKACRIARANRALLEGGQALVADTDGDGKPEPMSETDRAAARDLNARQIATFCPPAPAAPGSARPPSG